jgi:hypothetical protein
MDDNLSKVKTSAELIAEVLTFERLSIPGQLALEQSLKILEELIGKYKQEKS